LALLQLAPAVLLVKSARTRGLEFLR